VKLGNVAEKRGVFLSAGGEHDFQTTHMSRVGLV
jgi:hypothetical protein